MSKNHWIDIDFEYTDNNSSIFKNKKENPITTFTLRSLDFSIPFSRIWNQFRPWPCDLFAKKWSWMFLRIRSWIYERVVCVNSISQGSLDRQQRYVDHFCSTVAILCANNHDLLSFEPMECKEDSSERTANLHLKSLLDCMALYIYSWKLVGEKKFGSL